MPNQCENIVVDYLGWNVQIDYKPPIYIVERAATELSELYPRKGFVYI